jgi:hypothetical protein
MQASLVLDQGNKVPSAFIGDHSVIHANSGDKKKRNERPIISCKLFIRKDQAPLQLTIRTPFSEDKVLLPSIAECQQCSFFRVAFELPTDDIGGHKSARHVLEVRTNLQGISYTAEVRVKWQPYDTHRRKHIGAKNGSLLVLPLQFQTLRHRLQTRKQNIII